MPQGVVLTMIDGMRIVVSNSIESIASYVVRARPDLLRDERLFIDRARTANDRGAYDQSSWNSLE
jgi:hypothetical protein